MINWAAWRLMFVVMVCPSNPHIQKSHMGIILEHLLILTTAIVISILIAGCIFLYRQIRVGPKKNRPGGSVPKKSPMVSTSVSGQRTEIGTAPSPSWMELKGANGDGSAALVCYDLEQSGLIRNRFDKLQLEESATWHGGNLGTEIVDQLAGASSLVASGLQSGQMFQVIGTPHLIEGLNSGTLALMQTAEGTLGTVVRSSGGNIAGQLRFAPASMAPVFAPVIAWQVLHAIASTSQLRRINLRLDVMQRMLEAIAERIDAVVLGEVLNAIDTLDDILAEHANTGTFTRDMEIGLRLVKQDIGKNLMRNRRLVDLFESKASEVQSLRGKIGAYRTTILLKEKGPQAVHDMQMLIGLVAADLRLEKARMLHALEHNPKDLQRRLDRVTEKTENYRELLANLPSVEHLKIHVDSCVEEMSKWQRKVSARGVLKETTGLPSLNLRDPKLPVWSTENLIGGSYVFWKDGTGETKIHMLPNGDDHE